MTARNVTKPTKVERQLQEAEEAHAAADPERAEVLRRTRAFKHSWVELAESLTLVKREGRFRAWGYAAFEDYVKKELHLRAETADKLTGSFLFLQTKAPNVLLRDGVKSVIPSFQSVDFLRRAESEDGAPSDVVDEIRERVLGEAPPASAISLSKAYGERVFPTDPEAKRERDLAGIRNVAARLRALLAETDVVPGRVARELDAALERLLESLEQRAA